MANNVIQPEILRVLEDEMRYIIVDTAKRLQADQWWRRVMKTRTSSTKKQLLQWMLNTVRLVDISNGGVSHFQDLVEVHFEITNEKFGVGLKLTSDEIDDGVAADRAGQWARQVAGQTVIWPQDKAAYLLKNGKSLTCYDDVSFFHTEHPINPYMGADGGVFPNLFWNMPFNTENLTAAVALIKALTAPDGHKRHIKPKRVIAGPDLEYDITQALAAEFYGDPNASGAPASNIIKTRYGFEDPVIGDELDEAGVWYIGADLEEDDELAGLIYQERKPFSMNSYSPLNDVVLAQMDEFEWLWKGRNTATYGHPFLLFRFEPGAAPE